MDYQKLNKTLIEDVIINSLIKQKFRILSTITPKYQLIFDGNFNIVYGNHVTQLLNEIDVRIKHRQEQIINYYKNIL